MSLHTAYELSNRRCALFDMNPFSDTPEALSQTDNTDRMAAAGGGVSLYRTLDGYPFGQVLAEPELITTDTWAEFGHDYYGVSRPHTEER